MILHLHANLQNPVYALLRDWAKNCEITKNEYASFSKRSLKMNVHTMENIVKLNLDVYVTPEARSWGGGVIFNALSSYHRFSYRSE